jgi:RHS repeat-associated protein
LPAKSHDLFKVRKRLGADCFFCKTTPTWLWRLGSLQNQLVEMQTTTSAQSQGQSVPRLRFTYNSQARRVRKLVETFVANEWILTQDRRFLYNGWNLIAEFEMKPNATALTLHASYARGLDLSGRAQGAGGVGALLFVRSQNTASATATAITTAPTHDGYSNITAYGNLTNGQVIQHFEYDAFGNELSLDSQLSSSTSTAPSFRFSTKYTDPETNLLYYGYRYYAPELGRWMERDLIEEMGGLNLYGMVNNTVPNSTDYLGKFNLFESDSTGGCEEPYASVCTPLCQAQGYVLGVCKSEITKGIDCNLGSRKDYRKWIAVWIAVDRYCMCLGSASGAGGFNPAGFKMINPDGPGWGGRL